MEKECHYSSLDVYQTAFIVLHGIKPILKVNHRKVSFSFSLSEKLSEIIYAYHRGAQVDALLFANTIKNLKGQIFELKDQG